MLCTSGWFNLKSISSLAVNSPNAPKKMVKMRDGTMPEDQRVCKRAQTAGRTVVTHFNLPTAAIAFGNVSIPLLTISAIMKNATYCDAHVQLHAGVQSRHIPAS